MMEQKNDEGATSKTTQETVEELRQLIQDHRVCWGSIARADSSKRRATLKGRI